MSDRYNTKRCKCGTVTSALAVVRIGEERHPVQGLCELHATDSGTAILVANGSAIVHCRGCGTQRWARRVLGRVVADKKCDGRCEGATGHQCECQCGGKNHGRAAA